MADITIPQLNAATSVSGTDVMVISQAGVTKKVEVDKLLAEVRSDLNEIEQEQILGGVYDVSSHNDGAVFESLSTLLGSANLSTIIPTSVRRGGMSIRFIQGSVSNPDNKYVQYRLMADGWSINPNDWSFCGDDVLVENTEWIKVITDNQGRILCGIKSDGSIEWGVGIPTPVKEYVNNFVIGTDDTSIDGLNKIIVFLDDFSTSDTLKALLGEKVDKVDGESLIDTGFASSNKSIENSEYLQVTTDSEDKLLEGINKDGEKTIFTNVQFRGSVYFRTGFFCNIYAYSKYVKDGYWDDAFRIALLENDNILIPSGEYDLANEIVIPRDNIFIVASNAAKIFLNTQSETRSRLIYAENKDKITIIGGYWDAWTKCQQAPLIVEHACRGTLSFLSCSKLTIKDCTLTCFLNSFCIQPDSCSNMIISNIHLDNVQGVGIQVGGNTHNFDISNISGSSADDMVALNGYDYWTSSAEIGTIHNGKVHNLYPNSASSAVRLNAGIATKDNVSHIGTVKDVIIENIYGFFSHAGGAIQIGTDFDQYGGFSRDAEVDNIYIKNVNCKATSSVNRATVFLYTYAGTITLDGVSDSGHGLIEMPNPIDIKTLVIKNYKVKDDAIESIKNSSNIKKLILYNVEKNSSEAYSLISCLDGEIELVKMSESRIVGGYSVISIASDGVVKRIKYEDSYISNTRLGCNYNSGNTTPAYIDNTELVSLSPSEGNVTHQTCVYQ